VRPPSGSTLRAGSTDYRFVDLHALAGPRLAELPVVLRLLLENVARTQSGVDRDEAIASILGWLDRRTSEREIPVLPGRVLMHDTTSTPALVDIAAMRDAIAEAGGDPASLVPTLPVDVSVDHSLAVEVYARPDAVEVNQAHELRRNAERYRFMRWAAQALPGVRIHPPGTGIMHTINLEQLATVVDVASAEAGTRFAHPDLMIGTDSHTPMVNGIGVLGWGVGGLEAETVMFGLPTVLRVPDVIGVRLVGKLAPGVLATDLAITVTHELRKMGVSGEFVEFFGPGASSLTAGDRGVVANMAPEYGATTGYFPIDARTLDYLRATGRDAEHVALVETYARRNALWLDPHAAPRYTRTIEIDLARVEMQVAGPRRPQDAMPFWNTAPALRGARAASRYPIAIAAIASCTNTSEPRLLIAAGLVARKARERGLTVPRSVKTSLTPGSPAAAMYLRRAGLDADLSALGFDIAGYGCATCIGNPGPLPPAIDGSSPRVAVLSGNRNFPGRVHPDLDLAFIMSPPLVVAFALAGDASRNLRDEPVQGGVMLGELWPSHEEIEEAYAASASPRDFAIAFASASHNPQWESLATPRTPRFPWSESSTILRRPPFVRMDAATLLGRYVAHALLVLGDDITTDHISPASAIPPGSFIADFLVERGEARGDLNVFASRRGNWEVMMRGAFYNRSVSNLAAPGAPVGHTIHAPSGAVLPIWEAAQRYRDAGESAVIVAGHRYGMGSSRDWAAKAQRLLGVRAVLASSFERIHRSNLIGMGILPLRLPADVSPMELGLQPGDRLEVDAPAGALEPRAAITVRVHYHDGRDRLIDTLAAVETRSEVETLRHGGVIPRILHARLD